VRGEFSASHLLMNTRFSIGIRGIVKFGVLISLRLVLNKANNSPILADEGLPKALFVSLINVSFYFRNLCKVAALRTALPPPSLLK
jgi:hypothetical protein